MLASENISQAMGEEWPGGSDQAIAVGLAAARKGERL